VVTFLLGFTVAWATLIAGRSYMLLTETRLPESSTKTKMRNVALRRISKPDAETRNDQTESINQDRWANMKRG